MKSVYQVIGKVCLYIAGGFTILPTLSFAKTIPVDCDGFNEYCNVCLKETNHLYYGYQFDGVFGNIFDAGNQEAYIYLDENIPPKSQPIKINYKYNDVVTENITGVRFFDHENENLVDKNKSNGEKVVDEKGDILYHFPKQSTGSLVRLKEGSSFGFTRLSNDVIAGGRGHPLFEIEYHTNFRDKDFNSRTSVACIKYFPAWCGDGVVDTQREECDGSENCSSKCNNSN